MTPEGRTSDVMAHWTTDDVKNHVRITVAIKAAIAEEREACATAVCEDCARGIQRHGPTHMQKTEGGGYLRECRAAAIRARA